MEMPEMELGNPPQGSPDFPDPVSCRECLRVTGQGRAGTHWICEDCRYRGDGGERFAE